MTEQKKEIIGLYKWFNKLKDAVANHIEGTNDVKTIATNMIQVLNNDIKQLDKPSIDQIRTTVNITERLYRIILMVIYPEPQHSHSCKNFSFPIHIELEYINTLLKKL